MNRWTRLRPLLFCSCLALTFSTGACGKKRDTPGSGRSSTQAAPTNDLPTPPSATVDRAAELVEAIEDGTIPFSALEPSKDGEALLHIASSSENPVEQAAALLAMRRIFTWSSVVGASNDRPVADERYHQIVSRHLQSKDPNLRAAAVEAAFHSQKSEDSPPDISATLIDLAQSDANPAMRVMALASIHHPDELSVEAKDAFLKLLLDPDPELVAASLDAIRDKAYQLPDSEGVHKAVAPLLGHSHPCVRGLAASVLARLDYGDADDKHREVAELVRPLLGDQDAYVAASAMYVMSFLREYAAIPEILAAAERSERTACKLEGWTHPSGSAQPRTLTQAGPILGYAAHVALQSMTYKTPTEYTPPGYEEKMDLAMAKAQAAAWYKANKASLGAQ